MFLSELNENQKVAFLSIAKSFITADNILDLAEYDAMSRLENEADIKLRQIPTVENIKVLAKHFDTKKAKVILLLELLLLANVDNDFAPEESEFIKQVADAMWISQLEVNDYANWVSRKIAVDNEARKFME